MIRKRHVLPVLLLSSTAAMAKPPADDQVPRSLISLRSQLFDAGEAGALKDVPRFRPLCDAQGFPLVGNAVRKTNVYQPSSFCTEVRAREKKA